MVTVTDIQRNFKHILDNPVPKDPTVVVRDSVAEAVIVSFSIYMVSGDEDLHSLKNKIEGIKVVTAGKFLKLIK